jgi:hypothetical protein
MAVERFDFAIFTLRKEIGRKQEQARQRMRRLPTHDIVRCIRATLEEFEERDREVAELKAAMRRLQG